jgi:hypothetical protein
MRPSNPLLGCLIAGMMLLQVWCALPVAATSSESDGKTPPPAAGDAPPISKPVDPAEVPQLVKDMDADDFFVRDAATRRLLMASNLRADQLAAHFNPTLSAEQRWRLQVVIEHHFVRSLLPTEVPEDARGVLGVTIQGVSADPDTSTPAGIRIAQVMPGMPAFAQLQVGDFIVEVDGKAITNGTDAEITLRFSEAIGSRKAGQVVRLGVLRSGKVEQRAIQLGQYDDLLRLYSGETGNMELRDPYSGQWTAFRRRHMPSTVHDEEKES